MDSKLNRGEWKSMETVWAKALESGKKVDAKIEPIYAGKSQRPVSFDVQYKIEGSGWELKTFDN